MAQVPLPPPSPLPLEPGTEAMALDAEAVVAALQASTTDWTQLPKSEMDAIGAQVKLSDEDKQRITSLLKSEFTRAKNFHDDEIKPAVQDWREAYAEYRPADDAEMEGGSHIAIPMVAPGVDFAVARVHQVLAFSRPLFQPFPLKPQISRDAVSEFGRYFNAKIEDPESYVVQSLIEAVHDAAITGTSIAKIYWDRRTIDTRRYQIENGIPRIVEQTETQYEGFVVEPLRIERVFYPQESDWDTRAIDRAHWFGHIYEERVEVARQKAARGFYYPEVIEELADKVDQVSREPGSVWTDSEEMEEKGITEAPLDKSANAIDLVEIYIHHRIKGDKREKLYLATWSHIHNKLVGFRNAPFFKARRPFVAMRYIQKPGRFRGKGVGEILRHLQEAADSVANSGINMLHMELRPPTFMAKDPSIKRGKQDILRPGGLHQVESPKDVMPIQIRGNTEGAFAVLDQLSRYGNSASGSDLVRDDSRVQGETAEAAQLRFGKDLPFFNLVAANVADAMTQIARRGFELIAQCHPQEDTYLFSGLSQSSQPEQVRSYTLPEDPTSQFGIRVDLVTSAANPEVRKIGLQHLQAGTQQFYEQMLQRVQLYVNPQTPDGVRHIVGAAMQTDLSMLRQLAQCYDATDVVAKVPVWPELETKLKQDLQQAQEAMKNQKPPVPDSALRAMAPDWAEMPDAVKMQFLQKIGFEAPPDMIAAMDRAMQQVQAMEAAKQQQQGEQGGIPQPPGPAPAPAA